jgi:translation initiation factor IF-2
VGWLRGPDAELTASPFLFLVNSQIRIVSSVVGEVTDKDVEGAADMQAVILAFNAKVPSTVQKAADKKKVRDGFLLKVFASIVDVHIYSSAFRRI